MTYVPKYQATVYLGESDPEVAAEKAQGIYEHLGDGFFQERVIKTPEAIVAWITRTLLNHDLRIDFEDANDAMLFKLTWA